MYNYDDSILSMMHAHIDKVHDVSKNNINIYNDRLYTRIYFDYINFKMNNDSNMICNDTDNYNDVNSNIGLHNYNNNSLLYVLPSLNCIIIVTILSTLTIILVFLSKLKLNCFIETLRKMCCKNLIYTVPLASCSKTISNQIITMLLTFCNIIPPLPSEWINCLLYLKYLLKLIAKSQPFQTIETTTTQPIYVSNIKPKSKSHSRMAIRRRRIRKYPCTCKTRIRRKKNVLHVKFITFQRYKQDAIWQLATLSALLTIYSTLCNYYTAVFGKAENEVQSFPLINLNCNPKLPHLRWHGLPPDTTTTAPTTNLICPYKSRRLTRWLNSKKTKSRRRQLRILRNGSTVHRRGKNEWAQIKTYGLIV